MDFKRFWDYDLGFWVQDLVFKGFWDYGFGFWVQDLGFKGFVLNPSRLEKRYERLLLVMYSFGFFYFGLMYLVLQKGGRSALGISMALQCGKVVLIQVPAREESLPASTASDRIDSKHGPRMDIERV